MQELLKIIQGDAVSGLKTISDKSVHCTITSSPYFGLRSYGSPPINWPEIRFKPMAGLPELVIPAMDACLGNEETPEAFVGHLVENAREVWRVLRNDGIYWLNLGDSYSGYHGNKKCADEDAPSNKNGYIENMRKSTANVNGIKQKDLMMIPVRVALALQADGWYLRQDIIWQKNNPMPESVTDRCTKSHEHIFMLTKSPKYFFDNEAIKEPSTCQTGLAANFKRTTKDHIIPNQSVTQHRDNRVDTFDIGTRNKRDVWSVNTRPFRGAHFAVFPPALVEPMILAGTSEKGCCPQCGAPWTRIVESKPATSVACPKTQEAHEVRGGVGEPVGTIGKSGSGRIQGYSKTVGWQPGCCCGNEGFKQDDFEIINTPTGERVADDPSMEVGRAGMSRPRGDNEGSRPITRLEQRQYAVQIKQSDHVDDMRASAGKPFDHYVRTDKIGARPVPQDLLDSWIFQGWITKVEIPERNFLEPVPCTVLDQFFGSGTTGMVALGLGRRAIGVELNPDYIKIAEQRCSDENVAKEMAALKKSLDKKSNPKISSSNRKQKPVPDAQLSLAIV